MRRRVSVKSKVNAKSEATPPPTQRLKLGYRIVMRSPLQLTSERENVRPSVNLNPLHALQESTLRSSGT